jgi:hypothetical protein
VQVLIQINDAFVPSIGAARADYNAKLPATITDTTLPPGSQTVPNPALITSDEAFVQFQNGEMFKVWLAKYGALPTPVVIDGVPQEVTRRQAKQALIQEGKIDLVQPAIDAITDPTQRALMQSEWDDSQTFQRQRPSLIQMATAIGLTSTDIDDLFKLAATL